MSKYRVGEEVRYDDEVFTVSQVVEGPQGRYRLLATRPAGTRFMWVQEDEIEAMDNYLRPQDDTSSY